MQKHLKELFSYRDMVKNLVKRELRGKYKGSILGFLWTFINPLCQIIVYTIVFSLITRNDLDQFYVYMIAGMIPWTFFDLSLRNGCGSVRYQGNLVKKIYFPREVLPISTVTANFINMLLCFILVFLTIILSGRSISFAALLFLPVIMVIEYLFILGLVLIVSSVTVYLKDLEHIVNVLLMMWIYLTPILYPITLVPEKVRMLLKVNPMTAIIECYHQVLYWGEVPSLNYLGYGLICAIVIVIVGELIFNKLSSNFAEEL